MKLSTLFLSSLSLLGFQQLVIAAPTLNARQAVPVTLTYTSSCLFSVNGQLRDFIPSIEFHLSQMRQMGPSIASSQPSMPIFGDWFSLWLDPSLFPMFKKVVGVATSSDSRLRNIKFDCKTLPAECNSLREPFGKRVLVSNAETNTIFACPGLFQPDSHYERKLFRQSTSNEFKDMCDKNDPNFSLSGADFKPIGEFEWLPSILLREMAHMRIVWDLAQEKLSANRHREVERYGIAANHIFWQRRCNVGIPAAKKPAKL